MTATLPPINSASTNIKKQSSEPKPERLASNLFPLNQQHQWFLKSSRYLRVCLPRRGVWLATTLRSPLREVGAAGGSDGLRRRLIG